MTSEKIENGAMKHWTSIKIDLKYFIFSVLVIFMQRIDAVAQSGALPDARDYLYKEYMEKGADAALSGVDAWKQAKLKEVHESIASLPDDVKAALINDAEEALKMEWGLLLLTDYLKFSTEGNQVDYGTPLNQRKSKLTRLVIGELVDRKGKYIPEIANGVWLFLEESTWVLPQHLKIQKAGLGLPDPGEQVIDLRSADISAFLSWIRFLHFDKLNAVSPMLIKRIDYELKRRTITPFLERDDLHWLGFTPVNKINNWNTWINANLLVTAVFGVDDEAVRDKMIARSIRSADKFLNNYPKDGGCDEGITYWQVAGGKLIESIDLLSSISNHKLDWSDNKLIHSMGTYIYKMHIANDRYVNFADALALAIPSPLVIYTFGKTFNDTRLKRFAAYLYEMQKEEHKRYAFDLMGFMAGLEVIPELLRESPAAPLLRENVLPDLQVYALREKEGSSNGLFFAAKGGHNGESHNHNDVGNFVLYLDGKPVIVDAGVDTYVKGTFSSARYKIWNMQSQWHNCPTLNGVQQMNGKKFAARNVEYSRSRNEYVLSMDLAGAYSAKAEVAQWQRRFVFSPGKRTLSLREEYAFKNWQEPFGLHFMTSLKPEKHKDGTLRLDTGDAALLMRYDARLFDVVIEDRPTGNGRLAQTWPDGLTRITLRSKSDSMKGSHTVLFKVDKL